MIVLSDNTATNLLVNKLGTSRIDARLVSYGLKARSTPSFETKPDIFQEARTRVRPRLATPREMAKLMALIAEGRVDKEASASILRRFACSKTAMIPRLLPDGVQVGNKTGTDSEKLADSKGRRGAIPPMRRLSRAKASTT